jgi:hypothetical protein
MRQRNSAFIPSIATLTGRQFLLNNAVALARTAAAFGVPVVVSTSASRVYSGPLLPALQDALPAVKAIESA